MQAPFDFTVVMPSILRPTINEAIASIFAQKFSGRVQLLLGIDTPTGDLHIVEPACPKAAAAHHVGKILPIRDIQHHVGTWACI